MLVRHHAIGTVMRGLTLNTVPQTLCRVRTFSSPAVRRFRAKKNTGSSIKYNNDRAASATYDLVPHRYDDMDSATLLTLSGMGIHSARIEILIRHIMAVDCCSRDEATKTFDVIAAKNREGMALAALPYQLGIIAGVSAAAFSLPMVFSLSTSMWFNEHFVTTSIPENEDLETMLEVGSWAWNWMEPPLGTLSFLLLALQFSRAQMHNLGIRPYTLALKKRRGRALAGAFPRYSPKILKDFSETDPLMKLSRPIPSFSSI